MSDAPQLWQIRLPSPSRERRMWRSLEELDGRAPQSTAEFPPGADSPDGWSRRSFLKALVLGVYDPDRASLVRHAGEPSSWSALLGELGRPRTDGGAGLRLLLEPTSSPTVARLLARVRQLHPKSKVTFYAPCAAAANAT